MILKSHFPGLELMKRLPQHVVHQLSGQAADDNFRNSKGFPKANRIAERGAFLVLEYAYAEPTVFLDTVHNLLLHFSEWHIPLKPPA